MNFFSEINAQQGQLLSGGTPVLVSLTVSGPTNVIRTTTAQYVCTANYSDGSTSVITPAWSENSIYAGIDTNGLLTAYNPSSEQNVTITADYEGVVGTLEIIIRIRAYKRITIEGPATVPEESEQQYLCLGTHWDDTTEYVSPAWSDNSSYATIPLTACLERAMSRKTKTWSSQPSMAGRRTRIQ